MMPKPGAGGRRHSSQALQNQPMHAPLVPVPRRRFTQALLGGLAMHALSGCSGTGMQVLTQHRLTLSAEQLQAALDRRFPLEHRVAELLDVRLSAPRLKLLPDSGRVATELELEITERLRRSRHPAQLALDFGLRFQASDRSVRLRDVRVTQLAFTRLAPAYQELMNRYVPPLAERALDGWMLHQVSEADWNKLQRLGLQPGEFTVTAQGLNLDFRPPQPSAPR